MRERYRKSIPFLAGFGGSEESAVRRLQRHVMPVLAEKSKNLRGKVAYDYGRRINGTESPG